MAEKIAIIVGEHPMTANAGKQYAEWKSDTGAIR